VISILRVSSMLFFARQSHDKRDFDLPRVYDAIAL